MKNRLYFIPIGVIVVTLFIVGTFCDLNIAKAIYSERNGFGVFLTGIMLLPISLFAGAVSGAFIRIFKLNPNYKTHQKVILIILSCVFLIGSIISFGYSITCDYAYNINVLFSIPIGLITAIPSFILGYLFYDKVTNKHIFKLIIFIVIIVGLSYVCVDVIKRLAPRCRYFVLFHFNDESLFRPWYDPSLPNEVIARLKEYYKDAVKSFPSGHSCLAFAATTIFVYFPLLNKKLMKYQPLFLYGGFVFYLLIAFSRMLIGYHYLSDVSFSGILCLIILVITNEIILRKFKDVYNDYKEIK